MRCTYKYPTGHQVKKVFWSKTLVIDYEEPPDLSENPEYSQRLQYLGDKQQNCTIRLSHVTLTDEDEYYFSFITDKPDGKWTGESGVTLTVTDLQVESPERVTEGDSVTLRCKSSCALTDRATFIWYRNSQPLTERRDRNNELLLQSVRREDSGRYSCTVDGHTHISPEVQLNVMSLDIMCVLCSDLQVESPKRVTEGDSVTLRCKSSCALTDRATFIWYRNSQPLTERRDRNNELLLQSVRREDSGRYSCAVDGHTH
ncbi:hypothetical protein PO909_016153, partial [Leuciscus waleckii]